MSNEASQNAGWVSATHALDLLEGQWAGEGTGSFPTIDPFDYRETLIFERRNAESLFYTQRTDKRPRGQQAFVTSHWESGFIRVLESNELELINSQSGGRAEVLIGKIAADQPKLKLEFASKAITNDERIISTTRTFEIENDMLTYDMQMWTTGVNKLSHHVAAKLRRTG